MLLTKKRIFISSQYAFFAALLSVSLLPAPVYAAGQYFSIEAGVKEFRHDDVQASLATANMPEGAADGDIQGHGIDVTIGGMSLQSIPALTGSNPVLEVQLHYATADESHSQTSSTGLFGFVPIDGSSISTGSAGPTLHFETEYDQYGIDALVRSEVSSTATNKTTAIWGLTYSRFEESHEFSGRTAAGAKITDRLLKDNIETDYFGLVLGIGTEHQLGSGWAFSASGRVDLLLAKADLDANQTLLIFGAISASDNDTEIATRLQGKVGITKDFGGFSLGANATVDYLSYAPTVNHPLYNANTFQSHLEEDSLTSYGVSLELNIPF